MRCTETASAPPVEQCLKEREHPDQPGAVSAAPQLGCLGLALDVAAGPVRQIAETERQHQQPADMHDRTAHHESAEPPVRA